LLFWKIFLSWVAFCGSHVSHFVTVNMKCISDLSMPFQRTGSYQCPWQKKREGQWVIKKELMYLLFVFD
jgi:hypothetical protein